MDEEAYREREAARDAQLAAGWPHLRLLAQPSDLGKGAGLILAALDELGETGSELCVHPGIATLDLRLSERESDARRDLLAELHQVASNHRLRVQWLGPRRELPEGMESLGPETPALTFMRMIQDSLDPGEVFARGRFHGGL